MKRIPTRNTRRRITVARDDAGVPHIEADSWRGALYGLGYMHALDRPTQMLFARTVARGNSAARIADRHQLLETDRFFRRVGLHRRLQEEVRLLDDDTFADLTAYCEGVNDGIQQIGRSLPMWATGFRPETWTQQSVLLIGNLLSFSGLTITQQQSERLMLELIQLGIDEARLRELFAPFLDDVDFEILKQIKISSQLSDEALDLIVDLPRIAGSNAWAVAPRRSATGRAILASDPHLEVNHLPAIWYEAVLRWPEDYVMGASLPGCPLFAVARTKQLSWGVTYLKGDTSDYFIENCRPGGASGWQYRRGDQWHDFQVREETIKRKDGPPEFLRVYFNDQGTLEGDVEQHGAGLYLSSCWVGEQPGSGRAMGTWVRLPHCQSTREGMEVVRANPQPTLCFVFADGDGHIGLQASGWFPKRSKRHIGLLPIPAWDVKNHWKGRLEESVLYREYDPPQGFVATANEPMNPKGGPLLVTKPVPDYRKRRIDERLSELPQATLDDMKSIQYDVLSTHARRMLKILLPCLPEGELKDRLSQWDLCYEPDSRDAALFQRFYINVVLEIFGQSPLAEGGFGVRRLIYLCTRVGYSTMVLTAIDDLLEKEESTWWSQRDKCEMIRAAAERAVQSKDVPWSKVNSFRFTNRFFESDRFGRLFGFHTREVPMRGNHATPFQGHLLRAAKRAETFAPSYHFVTDLGTDEAWTNLPGGPSESRFSRYYRTDLHRWLKGEYKRLAPEAMDA